MSSALFELVYTSIAQRPFTAHELRGILERARPSNQRLGLTGILLYRNSSFLQVLEGDEAVVMERFERISRDPRHGRVRIVRKGPITCRSFGDWSMGFVSLDPKALPAAGSHGLSSNGTLEDDKGITELLDRFRNGEWTSVIT
jgi:Sensors of blue-light using FAD